MTEIQPNDPNSVPIGGQIPSQPIEAQIKRPPAKRRPKALALDTKSTDRLIRMILSSPGKGSKSNPESESKTQIEKEGNSKEPGLHDLIHVHVWAGEEFGETREDLHAVLRQIDSHPALKLLDEAAQYVAATHIYQARAAYRLKKEAKYWILFGLGDPYPYPLGVRVGAVPSWKRPLRSAKRLQHQLRKVARQALRVEADAFVSSRPELMPAELLLDAEIAVEKAISAMQVSPNPVSLRSKFRDSIRPDAETESVNALAYVLDCLYREHSQSPLKAKEIECRIADLEAAFLDQNIHCGADFGCPAVRLQVRSLKRSKLRAIVDRGLLSSFKIARKTIAAARRRDPSRLQATYDQFCKQRDRHTDVYYEAWVANKESRLKEQFRQSVAKADNSEALHQAGDEYERNLRNLLDLRQRWTDEYEQHLHTFNSPDFDLLDCIKAGRKLMRRWELIWDLSEAKNFGLKEAASKPKVFTAGGNLVPNGKAVDQVPSVSD